VGTYLPCKAGLLVTGVLSVCMPPIEQKGEIKIILMKKMMVTVKGRSIYLNRLVKTKARGIVQLNIAEYGYGANIKISDRGIDWDCLVFTVARRSKKVPHYLHTSGNCEAPANSCIFSTARH
jgi:uncharacterized protein YcsI (UPF0317 family)